MNSFMEFMNSHGDMLAIASALLSMAAFVFSASNLIGLRRATRRLMRQLADKESDYDADLSDVTDRELRKIANYLTHFEDVRVLKDAGHEREREKDVKNDFFVFTRAFEDLDEDAKRNIVRSLKTERGPNKVRAIRNWMVHSHTYRGGHDGGLVVAGANNLGKHRRESEVRGENRTAE